MPGRGRQGARKPRKTIVGNIDPEILLFTVGKDTQLDLVLAEADCIGTAAHVRMLASLRVTPPVLSAAERDRVIAELIATIRNVRAGRFRISAADQDIHLAVERVLTRKLGETGRRVHTARSRNDQVATALRLYGKEQLLGLMRDTAALADVLLALARRHASVPMVGRTHLQPAMPSSVGLWAAAHAESLLDDLDLLKAAYDFNDRCPLGSAAGYGVPLPIDRPLTSRLLGFRAPQHNVLYASNARGKCESVILSASEQVMLSLSRLAEDLVLFSMPEFGYFRLPAESCTGSSIMPQKRNPDVLELVRARASRVSACHVAVMGVMRALPSGYNRDLQETKEPFIEGVATTRACTRIMAKVARDLSVDRKALRAGFGAEVFAADRALERVLEGATFRDAYQEVKADLDGLCARDPEQAIAARTHLGGTGFLDLATLRERSRLSKTSLSRARRRYESAISRLLGVTYPGLSAVRGRRSV